MRALEFWKTVTIDRVDLLGQLIGLLNERGVDYCVIGGQAVNAYVEPLVSLDLDLVIAPGQILEIEGELRTRFRVEAFPHSLDVSSPGSDLRVQIQTDPRYAPFVQRASMREVLGLRLPVADVADVLQGKVWAASDPQRRGTRRRKDLLDIERLVEAFPGLRRLVPPGLLSARTG